MARRALAAGRVVLVEDDPLTLNARAVLLRDAGYDAATYSTAIDALTSALAEPPSVVVTDLALPDIDGFSLALELRADRRTRHVPVIGMTAAWTADVRCRAARTGIDVLLLKPCAPEHLLAEIGRALQPRVRPVARRDGGRDGAVSG
jgi:DNA-binding response OmpR family regulator